MAVASDGGGNLVRPHPEHEPQEVQVYRRIQARSDCVPRDSVLPYHEGTGEAHHDGEKESNGGMLERDDVQVDRKATGTGADAVEGEEHDTVKQVEHRGDKERVAGDGDVEAVGHDRADVEVSD